MALVSLRQVLDAAAEGGYGVGSGEVCLVDPDQCEEFVARTGVDALAVAIGTSHGAYKFSREPDGDILAMHLIEEIHRRLPATHLVMHGSSSVPAALIERTDGRLAITAAVREAFAAEPGEWDPRHATRAAREGMRAVVAERMRQFGQAGHAAGIVPRSLAEMREQYAVVA